MSDRFPVDLLECPVSKGPVELKANQLVSKARPGGFPDLGGIPWLFKFPESWVDQWRARCSLFFQDQDRKQHRSRRIKHGVVGQVVAISPRTARVLLITDKPVLETIPGDLPPGRDAGRAGAVVTGGGPARATAREAQRQQRNPVLSSHGDSFFEDSKF